MFVSVPVMLNDMTTLFRSGLLIIYSLVVLIYKPIDFKKYLTIVFLFLITLIWYVISWQVNEQGYINFLFGAYGRNFGILALVGLYLITLESAEHFSKRSQDLVKSFYALLGLAIAYGFIQQLELDPINWAKGAGYGSTLGNPNFSSSLFGMLSIIPLTYYFKIKSYKRYIHLLLYISSLVLIFLSGSSQGFILFVVNFFLFILLIKISNFKTSVIKYLLFITLTLIFTSVFLVLKISQFTFIKVSLNNSLQISQRLEHWELGYRIWKDHPVFGVGLDNLQRYAGEYRSLEMTRWGQYTLPDRAHNNLIDMFVFGGLVTGIAYCIFIFLVFRTILRLYRNTKDVMNDKYHIHIFTLVWVTYLMQSMISPDHLLLTACGFMATGALLGIDRLNRPKRVSDAKNSN
jgi:O-antigen ligase